MDLGIRGRVAIVAASSKGLGKAAAVALACEGVHTVINGRSAESLDRAEREVRSRAADGAQVLSVVADVTTAEGCMELYGRAASRFGSIDILVNNSGGPHPGGFGATDDAGWTAGADSTLMNIVRLTRLVLPGMRERRWGRIVNITSLAARQPIEGLILSNTFRAGVHAMTKTLAGEVARDGVTINCICPGMHATDRLEELASRRAKERATSLGAEYARMAENIPMGRLGTPEEFATAVAYLCSAGASFVTGTSLTVDGGAFRGPA